MNDEIKNPRIADNPSAKELSDFLPVIRLAKNISGLLRKLGIKNGRLDSIYKTSADALEQSDILTIPDRFNDAFSEKGWIATGSMSADTMQRALELYEAGKELEAENEIVLWFEEDTINLFAINRAKKFNKALNRWEQLREALKLTLEERYMSAVPLILIACDGFSSDVMGNSPFVKDADLTAFDSITGHVNSLSSLVKLVTKRVRKSSDDELTLPLRHGILHGRSLGYANRTVCMKSWLLMIALVDWAYDKSSEEDRMREHKEKASFGVKDLATLVRKTKADKRVMEAFEPTEISGPFDENLGENTPEFAFIDFLTGWKDRNFGRMAKRALNSTQSPIKKLAGQMRNDAEFVELTAFEILSVRQGTVARADAVVRMNGKTFKGEVKGEFEIMAFRENVAGEIVMPTDDGQWYVQQLCIFDLMNENTITARDIRGTDCKFSAE